MIDEAEERHTFQDAVRLIAERTCKIDGHSFSQVMRGMEPISVYCDRGCGHPGWQLVARGQMPALSDLATQLFTLEQAQRELNRRACYQDGHDLQAYTGDHRYGEVDLRALECGQCDHPGWIAHAVCPATPIVPPSSNVLPCAGAVAGDG